MGHKGDKLPQTGRRILSGHDKIARIKSQAEKGRAHALHDLPHMGDLPPDRDSLGEADILRSQQDALRLGIRGTDLAHLYPPSPLLVGVRVLQGTKEQHNRASPQSLGPP